MNNEVRLIILRGNSGSGKSTTAKALQRKFGRGTLVISQDVIRRDMLWVKDVTGTKPNCDDFGEEDMKGWWREEDYMGIIPETCIPETMSLEETVEMISTDIMSLK
ncbi:AAA family ATPase [Lacrimispora sp.]|uniref:AAA family ATPase n=1 Tax=Lacrimispora sp. TaxID=2719234 RepID=UPI0028A87444|nr:AAA family ATPase [Lacrimispora sp.]